MSCSHWPDVVGFLAMLAAFMFVFWVASRDDA